MVFCGAQKSTSFLEMIIEKSESFLQSTISQITWISMLRLRIFKETVIQKLEFSEE